MRTNTRNIPITRYDKNLAHNPEDFSVYEDASVLAMHLSIFLAHQYQHADDYYRGIIRVDMNEFCERMGYDKASLLRKMKHPAHRKYWQPERNEYLMERVIENALYLMTREAITFSRRAVHKIEGEYQTISATLLLKSVTVYIDQANRNKIYYDVELGDVFKDNLSVFYVNLHLDAQAYKILRKHRATPLFLFLQNQQNYMQVQLRKHQLLKRPADPPELSRTYGLDELCRMAEINSSRPADCKKRLREKFDVFREYCGVDWELDWEINGRHHYRPRVTFNDLSQPLDEQQLRDEKREIFLKEVTRRLYHIYLDYYIPSNFEDRTLKFQEWMEDDRLNKDLKDQVFQQVQFLVWGKQEPARGSKSHRPEG